MTNEQKYNIHTRKIKEIVKRYCKNLNEIVEDIFQSVCLSLLEKNKKIIFRRIHHFLEFNFHFKLIIFRGGK